MSSESTQERSIEEDADMATVVDPDDYNRTQRFREIHRARQDVATFVGEMDTDTEGDAYYKDEAKRLGYLVSLYILELEPLIVKSDIDDGELVSEGLPYESLRDFGAKMGMRRIDDSASPPSPMQSMQMFAAANRFYSDIGMDLELQTDDGDAGFDYSDILDEGPPEGDAPQIASNGSSPEGPDDE